MMLKNKLQLIEYIYEPIEAGIFLYRDMKSLDDSYQLIIDGKPLKMEMNILVDVLTNGDFDLNKIDNILNSVLTQQAVYYKLMMEDSLDAVGMTFEEMNTKHNEMKESLLQAMHKMTRPDLKIVK